MQQAQTVQLRTNEQSLIRNLKFSFSNDFTVITELLQNARRAGASRVLVEYDAENKSLAVVDDGGGLRDFQKLLTIAETGWDESVVENEHPFGMGFFAALCSCEHVTVKSMGREVSFSTNDALSFSSLRVETSDFIGAGTQVIMKRCKDNVLGNINQLVKGFPLPVIYNGVELAREHAVNATFIQSDVGHISLEGLEDGSYGYGGDLFVYLQGLLVKHETYPDFSGIVHLDSKKYRARMPDRDKLVNEDAVLTEVDVAGIDIHRANLVSKLATLGGEVFIDKFHASVKRFYPELLNDLSFIPKQNLSEPNDDLIDLNGDCCNYPSSGCQAHLSRADVESGKVMLIWDENVDEETVHHWFLLQHTKTEVLIVEGLPDEHWATPFIKDVFSEDIDVRAINPGKVAYFSGEYSYENVKLCDSIHLYIESAGLEATVRTDALFNRNEADGDFILVPADCQCPGSVVSQISSYTDEWDAFQEGYRDTDESNLNAMVLRMRTHNPAKLLQEILNSECELSNNAYVDLIGKSFTVSIGEKGVVKVKLAKTAAKSKSKPSSIKAG